MLHPPPRTAMNGGKGGGKKEKERLSRKRKISDLHSGVDLLEVLVRLVRGHVVHAGQLTRHNYTLLLANSRLYLLLLNPPLRGSTDKNTLLPKHKVDTTHILFLT